VKTSIRAEAYREAIAFLTSKAHEAPLGDEDKAKGCSTYNGLRYAAQLLESLAAAAEAESKDPYCRCGKSYFAGELNDNRCCSCNKPLRWKDSPKAQAKSQRGPQGSESHARLADGDPDSAKADPRHSTERDAVLEPAIKPTHEAANAFWNYWRENGETHKHGYYESTWGAINAALRTSGVVQHHYTAALATPPASGKGEEVTDAMIEAAQRVICDEGHTCNRQGYEAIYLAMRAAQGIKEK